MPGLLTNDLATGLLNGAVAANATAWTLQTGQGALFPTMVAGDSLTVRCENDVRLCTARAGDVLTVGATAVEGYTAAAHGAGAAVYAVWTAASVPAAMRATSVVDLSPVAGGTGDFAATTAVDMTGVMDAVCGGRLIVATVINVIGTFAWGAALRVRVFQDATGGRTLAFQRNGVGTSPAVRWGGTPPSPVMTAAANALDWFVVTASPGGNLEIVRAQGPFA